METVTQLVETYGHWGEHPDYLQLDWVDDVISGVTQLGYWEWIVSQIQTEGKTYKKEVIQDSE